MGKPVKTEESLGTSDAPALASSFWRCERLNGNVRGQHQGHWGGLIICSVQEGEKDSSHLFLRK